MIISVKDISDTISNEFTYTVFEENWVYILNACF